MSSDPCATAAQITPESDVADPFPRCDGPGCPRRAATREGRFCAYHQGWFDAMDHIASLAEALYDRA